MIPVPALALVRHLARDLAGPLSRRWPRAALAVLSMGLLLVGLLLSSPTSFAQSKNPLNAAPPWSSLAPAQQTALKPLEDDWAGIDTPQRKKWVEVASRFDRMSPEERQRTQERMAQWARLSPKERNEARINFQTARQQLSPDERQQRWEAYRALPEQERQDLATQSQAKPSGARQSSHTQAPTTGQKVNTVPNPLLDVRKPKPVTPGITQAKPGATTTPMNVKPSPPLHQQTGLPKVAATPEFVDTTTLLPQRGAQGAAVEPRPRP